MGIASWPIYCLLLVAVVCSSNVEVKNSSDNIHSICSKKCGPSSTNNAERETQEACMLKCRNYIEETMFRPRVMHQSPVVSRQTRAAGGGGKSHMFVRVGRPDVIGDDEKRSQMRGSFVRIGRQSADDTSDFYPGSETDNENVAEPAKRRSDFVRIGRRGSSEQFVRIGRAGEDDESELMASDGSSKRAAKQAFVRIGRKTANFVRIGRAFVRIGKSSDDDGDTEMSPTSDFENAAPATATKVDEE